MSVWDLYYTYYEFKLKLLNIDDYNNYYYEVSIGFHYYNTGFNTFGTVFRKEIRPLLNERCVKRNAIIRNEFTQIIMNIQYNN